MTGKIGDADVAEVTINGGISGRITARSGAKASATAPSVEIGSKGINYINDGEPIKIQ